jgi:cytidylate kinase
MLAIGAYEKCKQYIKLQSSEEENKKEVFPCITISRQTGSGSYEVSERLINLLQQKTKDAQNSWTYFNKELMTKVIEEFKLPKAFSNYIVENKYSPISDAVSELLGVKPSEWTIVQKTTEIILQLAQFGKTIIVGRGSNVITSKLPNCIHIRLVAPIEHRIKHVQDVFNYSKTDAIEYIKKEDENRRKYLKSHFYKEPEDTTLYHLVLNTGKFNYDETAEIIADVVVKRFSKNFVE